MPALSPESLFTPCRFEGLEFVTSDQLEPLPGSLGQERAREAVELGIAMRHRGYNLFVLGPEGVGKRHMVEALLRPQAALRPPPGDWCYINNFADPQRPLALEMPAGWGAGLRSDMRQLVEELRASIPALFDSEEHRARAELIVGDIRERQEAGLSELGQEALRENITLIHTPAGFTLAPSRGGELVSPEDVMKMPVAEREHLQATMEALQQKLQKVIRQAQQLNKEKRARLKQLVQEMMGAALTTAFEDLREKYAHLPSVLAYLDAAQGDVMEHIEEFRPTADGDAPSAGDAEGAPVFRRFDVNLLVGDGASAASGAPVVFEDNPTHPNLLGRIEHVARFGMLVTDFGLIKAGALHRANGGYLVLDAYKVLTQPFAWEGLKRALAGGELMPEALGQTYGLISTIGLEPQPIPLDVKVVLLGDRRLYYMLLAMDREFAELFKVAADFEDDVERTPAQEALFARLAAGLARQQGLLPFGRAALARVIEQGARWAGDAARLSANIEGLTDLMREADQYARAGGGNVVEQAAVVRAIAQQRRRADRIHRRVHEAILRGELHVDTGGEVVGQVNGLSVSFSGDYAFANPVRITASTAPGEGEVVDIQREVKLGGPIHSKGVLILTALLGARFAREHPLALHASLVFEQTYGKVDGDSASVAEYCVLLSSLGGFPLRQHWAVTGSMDQHGRVQPIGGVNEKIEGFFAICRQRGLNGDQGVIIPAANVAHLMLDQDVVEAVRAGRFHIHAVTQVDEALSLLSGLPAGVRGDTGEPVPGSADERVARTLRQWFEQRMERTGKATDERARKRTGKRSGKYAAKRARGKEASP